MITPITVRCLYCSAESSTTAAAVSIYRFDEPSMPIWASFQCPACDRWQTHGLNQRTLSGLRETCEGQAREHVFRFHAINNIIKAEAIRNKRLAAASRDRMVWRVKHDDEFDEDISNFFDLISESATFAKLFD